MRKSDENYLLTILGFGFPENYQELEGFNSTFKDFSFIANANAINPEEILNTIKKQNVTVSHVDYHKRTVLAAEIVYRLSEEWSLGHVKLQKLMYLCQHVIKMSLATNFLKQAMGPYDPKMMRSLDSQFQKHQWFEFKKDSFPKYCQLAKAGSHKEWFENYYGSHLNEINFLIETFRSTKTPDIELVVTIYACWSEIIEKKEVFSEDLIIEKVYAWSEHKQVFSKEKISEKITWMLETGICPASYRDN